MMSAVSKTCCFLSELMCLRTMHACVDFDDGKNKATAPSHYSSLCFGLVLKFGPVIF